MFRLIQQQFVSVDIYVVCPRDKSQVTRCVVKRVFIQVVNDKTFRNRAANIRPHVNCVRNPRVRLCDLDPLSRPVKLMPPNRYGTDWHLIRRLAPLNKSPAFVNHGDILSQAFARSRFISSSISSETISVSGLAQPSSAT